MTRREDFIQICQRLEPPSLAYVGRDYLSSELPRDSESQSSRRTPAIQARLSSQRKNLYPKERTIALYTLLLCTPYSRDGIVKNVSRVAHCAWQAITTVCARHVFSRWKIDCPTANWNRQQYFFTRRTKKKKKQTPKNCNRKVGTVDAYSFY